MDTEGVWRLVEQARGDTGGDDAEAVAARMTALLAQREPAEIVAFVQPLWDLLIASYRADLWAAAYMINGGASDDGFDYFRGWLVSTAGSSEIIRCGAPMLMSSSSRPSTFGKPTRLVPRHGARREGPWQADGPFSAISS